MTKAVRALVLEGLLILWLAATISFVATDMWQLAAWGVVTFLLTVAAMSLALGAR